MKELIISIKLLIWLKKNQLYVLMRITSINITICSYGTFEAENTFEVENNTSKVSTRCSFSSVFSLWRL